MTEPTLKLGQRSSSLIDVLACYHVHSQSGNRYEIIKSKSDRDGVSMFYVAKKVDDAAGHTSSITSRCQPEDLKKYFSNTFTPHSRDLINRFVYSISSPYVNNEKRIGLIERLDEGLNGLIHLELNSGIKTEVYQKSLD